MLKIGICEDEKSAAEQLRRVLIRLLFPYGDVEIKSFTDGSEVIQAISCGNFPVDLLFLDIHLKQVDGLTTAAFIRDNEVDVDIIFLTASEEYVYQGYFYKAFTYLLKPLDEKRLENELVRYIKEKQGFSGNITVYQRGRELHLPLDRILYFKSEKRKITAYMRQGTETFYGKMDEIERLVRTKGFIRCHQSYIVNYNRIDSFSRRELTILGVSVPVSRKYYESIDRLREGKQRMAHSLALRRGKAGAVVFVGGMLLGTIIRINNGKEIRIGRDGARSDIVVHGSLISRLHVSVTYHSETGDYTVIDYSKNGVFMEDGTRLLKGEPMRFSEGEILCLGGAQDVIRLG